IRNVYVDRTVIRNTTIVNRVSYNGPGGIAARPTYQERMARNERHFQPTESQFAHRQTAGQNRFQRASYNHGRPPVTAMDRVNGRRYNQQARIANGVSSGNNEIGERHHEQQQRIGQGVRSGQMTPGEAARAENRERNINRQVHAERRANQGRLTPRERQQVNREQNHASREIRQEKHNEKDAPR
ncbi:MAG: YXWGXW repeat-containing protein, partial [Bryobacteraceae bacterium]